MSAPLTRFSLEPKREDSWRITAGANHRRHHDPAQYEREYATVENSSERVEYAIKLPGQGDQEYVYLPIDSKFPLADYYRPRKKHMKQVTRVRLNAVLSRS